jgi:cytochrome P450
LENPEEGMKVREIVEEFATFIAAGTDTTGHTINLCLYNYLTNPSCKAKLLQEVKDILHDPMSITSEDINKMNVMQGYLNETLRLGAPTFRTFFREALEDHNLGDIKIKKGTLVALNFFPNNYSHVYHQDPLTFNPERWLETNSQSKISLTKDPFSFIPFSAGARNCIGKNLATQEVKLIIGLFIITFEAALDKDFELKMATRFLYEPDKEIVYHIQEKKF